MPSGRDLERKKAGDQLIPVMGSMNAPV